MNQIKVLIVDDSKLACEILKKALTPERDIELIDFAHNGSQALEFIRKNPVKPDVVIMDLIMPIMGGIKTTEEIDKHFPRIKVIVLSSVKNSDTAICAIESGAKGYLIKDSVDQNLASVIRTVYQGYAVIRANHINNLFQNTSSVHQPLKPNNQTSTKRISSKNAAFPTIFWLVVLIGLINSISFTIAIPLIYPYAKQFGLGDFQASLLITTFALSQFLGTPILGKLSDLLGRKYILIFSLIGTVIANVMAGFAAMPWLLFVARMLDGLTGGSNSVASAVISDMTTKEQRARAFGIFEATFRMGFVVGPLLSYIAQQLPTLPGISSLGMSFIVSAAIALIAALLTIFFLPETNSKRQKFQIHWSDFTFGKVAFSIGKPKVGKLFILTFFSGISFTIFSFAFQPYFLNVIKGDPQNIAIVFAAVGILGFISQVFALQPLTRKFMLLDIIGITLFIRGMTFLLLPMFPSNYGFIIILVAFGLVNSFPMPLINTLLSLNSLHQEQGEMLSVNASYFSISSAIGPIISGLLVSHSYSNPFLITGIFTLFTAIFAFSLKANFVTPKSCLSR